MTGFASPSARKAAPAAGTTPGVAQAPPPATGAATAGPRRTALLPTAALVLGALYCLLPVAWVLVAATKPGDALFSTFTFLPGTGLGDNVTDLTAYREGIYWRWMLNSVLYAGLGAALSTAVSALAGYALAVHRFPGREAFFNVMLTGVLMPPVILAVPQYLLMAEAGLTGTYASVLLPLILSPYGVYLGRVYAEAAIPMELVEAGRMDGAGEWRIFLRIAVPILSPGLVTIFLFQFVAIWNNFLLPFIMLGDDEKFPMTVGLFTLLKQGASQPALYTLVITGALLAIAPLVALFLVVQRFWSLDLLSGAVKS
ncbi:carbohydrate ABC transporter permease [Streptomyces sp. NPDC126503]|uniref:carbohydrate ABC transporter permease n=1 Tax=Streptomyces sp. NPDC126503 TaxID=3155315 RepID=UPI003316E618